MPRFVRLALLAAMLAAVLVTPLPAQAAVGLGFIDSFERATFGANWVTSSTANGVAEINSDYPHTGSRSAFLGQKVAGNASASLTLALNLAGKSDVFLDFWVRSSGASAYRQIYISDNGGTSWKMISDLNTTARSYSHQLIDIAAVASANGLTLNNNFRIRFYFEAYSADASDGLIIDDVRITQRAQVVTTSAYPQDTFEGGVFKQGFYPRSNYNGAAEINSDYPHAGTKSVFLGQKVDGNANASLTLALDLSGRSDVFFDFWVRATGQSAYRQVYISDNGGTTWKMIRELNTTAQSFSHEVIDLAAAAAANGLTLNNKFRVQFYFEAYSADAGDGMVIDDLRLTQRAKIVAAFPYVLDSFEQGVLRQGLYPSSTYNGVAEINTDYPYVGNRSVFLGQKVAGNASASLVLALDLSGKASVFLDFWVRSTGKSAYRQVYISDDNGTTWEVIREYNDNLKQSFVRETIDIAQEAKNQGLALNNKFRISIYFGAYSADAGDGLVIDDLQLTNAEPGARIRLPLIRR